MIERTARALRQTNQYVVEHVGRDGLARQLSIAETSHCLNPDQVLHDWIAEYKLDRGTFDVSKIDPQFTDKVPTDLQMGKVYARLVELITPSDGDYVESILNVYSSSLCSVIDNYNSGVYFEPSYIHTRAYYNGAF